jgi:hypothetical protein
VIVTASTPVEISTKAIFTSGIIVTDTINLITFLPGSGAVGASSGSFVSGPVKKIGDDAFEFPVGKDTMYRPVKISAPDYVTDVFIAEYFDEEQTHGSERDSTLRFLSPCNYWSVNQLSGSSEVYLSFLYNTTFCDGRPVKPAHITYWDDSLWVNLGLAVDDGEFKKTDTTVVAFGDFIIGYAVGYPWEEDMSEMCNSDAIIALSTVCGPSSQSYNDKYGRAHFYIPEPTDPIKTIKVNFNIFQDDAGGCNFQNIPGDMTRLNTIIWYINNNFFTNLGAYIYLNNSTSVTLPNVSTPPPTFTDSRIRIQANVYFYQDDVLNLGNDNHIDALFAHVVGVDPARADQLNIMFTNGSCCGGAGGFASTAFHAIYGYNPIIVTFKAYSSNGPNYCTPSVIGQGGGDWWRAGHLAHEIGHTLGLSHTYIAGFGGGNADCNNSGPDYLWDVFGFDGPGGPDLCPFQINETSNIMGGTAGENIHISPLQLGFMHRLLSLGSVQRKWVICEDFTGHHDIIVDEPEVWDFDMKWYGNIIIEAGGEVEHTCKLQMPMHSKIIVQREGKLKVNGGLINGECDLWKGIEVWGQSQ